MNDQSFPFQEPAPLIPLLKTPRGGHPGPAVSARAFYRFLGLDPSQYSRWVKNHLLEGRFGVEGEDWMPLDMDVDSSHAGSYNHAKDYALTLDCAKMLAMLARSERGDQARRYFLECERTALQALRSPAGTFPAAPNSYPDALRALADNVEQRLAAENRMAVMEPKVALYDRAMDSTDLLDMLEVPRLLGLPYGRNELFKKLRQAGVIMRKGRLPYQRWMEVDPPLFRVVEKPFTGTAGQTRLNPKTMVTQRGLEFIDRKLGELD